MKTHTIKPMVLAVGLALAAPAAIAVTLDMSGSNIYMKFLDGNQRIAAQGSGDTATGSDSGQWTELELRIKAVISPKVEAGVRIQSRSSAAYWSEFGGFGLEGNVNNNVNKQKFMKLRGAYVQVTPGYNWLNMARIGSNDWGTFDPFTVGKVRYIDRDNYNGFYFKGPLGAGGSWEAARVSLPEYLQTNYGQGPACCTTDDSRVQEATYIGQVKFPLGGARIAASAQIQNDHVKEPDLTPFDGQDVRTFAKNRVYMLKAEGNARENLELKGAFYHSTFSTDSDFGLGNPWINSPRTSISDKAIKFDVGLTETSVRGLSLAYQYFRIGEGFYSNTAARTEADILLTEGSEAAWYNWGNPNWSGGAYSDFIQGAATPTGISGPNRAGYTAGGQNGLTDNAFKDFNEAPSESALGWRGHTLVANYDAYSVPMRAEFTRITYGNNWQNYTGPLSHFYAASQDRKTNIFTYKASHTFKAAGGLDASFKFKWVNDKDKVSDATSADDAEQKDRSYAFTVGNQLHNDIHGSFGFGHYRRDINIGGVNYDNKKNIYSLKFSYSLAGLEAGLLAQWIHGRGDPLRSGTPVDIQQYRMKATLQSVF